MNSDVLKTNFKVLKMNFKVGVENEFHNAKTDFKVPKTSIRDSLRPPSPPYNAEAQPRASAGLHAINSPYIVL